VTSDEKLQASKGHASLITHHPSRISLVVAMARNRVIGAGGRIPWHLPEELKWFKSVTMGHHIIMGRKTWESIGRPLPGRTSIVVTRQHGYRAPGTVITHSLNDAISACGGDSEIFVIGGADLFREALPLAYRLYLTTVEAEIPGDTTMPEFSAGDWREVSASHHPADARHAYPFRCAVYERNHR
jgi:dihydrofolate reductase